MRSSQFCSLFAISLIGLVTHAQPNAPLTVVNSATFDSAVPLSPGMVATAFGEFPGVEEAVAPPGEARTVLGNAQILVNGTAARLLYTSARQINFILPEQPGIRNRSTIRVTVNGNAVAETTVQMEESSPVLFVHGGENIRPAVAVMPDGALNSAANRAKSGDVVTLVVTGFAPEAQFEGAGVMVGLQHAPARRIRRAPSLPGIWLVEFVMPEITGGGTQAPVAVHAEGEASSTAAIWVQPAVS